MAEKKQSLEDRLIDEVDNQSKIAQTSVKLSDRKKAADRAAYLSKLLGL